MIPTKALIKCAGVACTVFQAYALWVGQQFSPVGYCTAIATLFGGNTLHEHISTYLAQRTTVDKL